MDPVIRPGPIDPSVLRLQSGHRSEDVWGGALDKLLTCQEHLLSFPDDWVVDQRVLHYMRSAGFFCVHRVQGGGVLLDRSLITALVERWRRETHIFHLPVGEATITLQDVAILLGLRVHGEPVTGNASQLWDHLVEELLGVAPDDDLEIGKLVLRGSTLKLSWLRQHFIHLPADADDETVQRFSRAYILMLMGAVLFPNKIGDIVSLLYLPLLRDLEAAGQLFPPRVTLMTNSTVLMVDVLRRIIKDYMHPTLTSGEGGSKQLFRGHLSLVTASLVTCHGIGETRLLFTLPSVRRPTSHYQPATTDHVLSRSVADMALRCMRPVVGVEDLPADKALPFVLETLHI
ncbi:Serine/threonine-protein phosphatase 7 long form-like protein [Bienertia sinuspersici]